MDIFFRYYDLRGDKYANYISPADWQKMQYAEKNVESLTKDPVDSVNISKEARRRYRLSISREDVK